MAETLLTLDAAHNLYSSVVAVWPFRAAAVDAVDALVASPISTAFNGVAGVLPARVLDATYGYVPDFTGTHFFKCGGVGSFERTDAYSVFVIMKPVTTTGTTTLYSKGNSTRGWGMQITSDNSILPFLCSAGASRIVTQSAAAVIPDNEWHSICQTYDGQSIAAGFKTYKDGVLLSMTALVNNLNATTITATQFSIGSISAVATEPLKGNIAFLAIFNKELSAAEQLFVYNNPFGLVPSQGASQNNSLNLSLHL